MRDFRKLEVWQESMKIVEDVYKLTESFPDTEKYGLVSQLRRCAVSMPSNISEGCSRASSKEFSRFLQIAIGSAFELETQLIISERIGYKKDKFPHILKDLNKLQKRLNALNSKLRS